MKVATMTALAAVLVSGASARANQVTINWFAVTPVNASLGDFNLPPCGTYNCGQVYDNSDPEVGPSLVGGLPVVSAANPAGLVEGTGNTLNWWTPAPGVVSEGQTVQSLPIGQNMFTPMGTGSNDDAPRPYQSAIFTATLTVGTGGGTITFGGDDDMFLALNGNVVDEVGGVHPFGTTSTYDVAPGTYAMDVFYADRHVTAAYADLSFDGNISTSGVPETSTWLMVLTGFSGLGYAAFRRSSVAKARIAV